jgi:predicted ATPase
MHLQELTAKTFRRFTDLTIRLDGSPRLVVLCGPNGNGKSSVFDAMRFWHALRASTGWDAENDYWVKGGGSAITMEQVELRFHEGQPESGSALKKAVYLRTAYRNDPAFTMEQIRRAGSLLDTQLATARRVIDNDVRVTDNYQRLVALTLDDVYGGSRDSERVADLREHYIGALRDAMLRLFPELELLGPGDPLGGGTFRFRKGAATDFAYKNLSGGEKAAFDLLLDLAVKTTVYDNTIFCIDEPEAHLNTRLQGALLDELLRFINDESQLWIATHSIGMLHRAQEMQEEDPSRVAFLDFHDVAFDAATVLEPTTPSRSFWRRTLETALGDLAGLVGPARVVLCEGKPVEGNTSRAEFDARCFRRIFGNEMSDTEFLSVGNSRDVETDQLRLGAAITTLFSGTTVLRVVDRDHRSDQEVQDLAASGVRVLSRRHLEAFLLDDEVLSQLCVSVGQQEKVKDVLTMKTKALNDSVSRGNDPDDLKSAASEIRTQSGSH